MRSLAHQARGDIPAALAGLRRALTLAEPEGYVRLFVDEGPPMATLLKAVARGDAASGYVRGLVAALTGTPPRTSPDATVPAGSSATVHPVRATGSVQCPTRTPATSVITAVCGRL